MVPERAPERMADPEFRQFLRGASEGVGVSLMVVDEAHCVSQWGHDFRPSYLSLRKAREDLGDPPVLATTATAPPHVRDDILHQLGMEGAEIVTTSFVRPNLHYECIAVPGDDEKKKTLVTLLKKLPRPGIVYCATVKMVESLYESLARHGIRRVAARDEVFDPAVHDAVARIEEAEIDEPTVREELQSGYTLYDRLLRPAMVRRAVPVAEKPERSFRLSTALSELKTTSLSSPESRRCVGETSFHWSFPSRGMRRCRPRWKSSVPWTRPSGPRTSWAP